MYLFNLRIANHILIKLFKKNIIIIAFRLLSIQGLIVSKGSCSCLNQISGFEPDNDTKSIVSIIGPQNVGPTEPLFDPNK